MDVDSEIIDLRLKVKLLEKKNKKVMWVLERNQFIIEALFDDFRSRKEKGDGGLEGYV